MTSNFIPALRGHSSPNVFNPWSDFDQGMDIYREAPEFRVRRLMNHFNVSARYLIIGEAPGYQGCRYTGVPFTSERLMCEGEIPRVMTGCDHTWRITQRQLPWSEPSATIVWKALKFLQIDEQTVCWNAYPWHPHEPGESLSNRTPTQAEIDQSNALPILEAVVRHFSSAVVISAGKISERCLTRLAIRPFHRIRHPANGGAPQFNKQLREIVG